jgi:hypothetical protein
MTCQEWWSEEGERKDAKITSARLRSFLSDARRLPIGVRYKAEELVGYLESYANGR